MGGGGKGGGGATPTYTASAPVLDMSPMYAAISNMQLTNSQALANSQSTLNNMLNSVPPTTATIDTQSWADKMAALKTKIETDMTESESKRRGRSSTIATSPLTDQPVTTTGSILTGK